MAPPQDSGDWRWHGPFQCYDAARHAQLFLTGVDIGGEGDYACLECDEVAKAENADPAGPFEIECPHCARVFVVEEDGEYSCPRCAEDVTVEEGEPLEPFDVECPHCGEEYVVDQDGEYICGDCGGEFLVRYGQSRA
jgi:DNA-directed RNA polymerase subunit RPC12/RpoP